MATYSIGLIGARGHTGRELLRLIAGHPNLKLVYASSREFAGKPVAEMAPEVIGGLQFEALDGAAAAARGADVCILAVPDGAAGPFVEAFETAAPETVLIDLGSDYRFTDEWAYGLPELNRENIKGKRIANPGCYATAMQLAIAPMLPHLAGDPVVFGVSGYSGAGTTPNRRNDIKALSDNLMPYALIGHKHEREATRHLGRPVRFSPHVAEFFRGIVTTVALDFETPQTADGLATAYKAFYEAEPLITVTDDIPEPKAAAGVHGATVGGFAVSEDGRRGVVVATLDNLLKGAATQAIQNVNIALGLPEGMGVPI